MFKITELNYLFLYFAIIYAVVFLLKLFFDKKSNKLFTILVFILFEGIFMICLFNILVIEWTFNTSDSGLLYSIMNSLLIGAFLVVIGFQSKQKPIVMKIIIIVIVSIFLISSTSLIGVRITLNLPFLIYHSFSTNTGEGAIFYITNIVFFDALIVASFISEGDKSAD